MFEVKILVRMNCCCLSGFADESPKYMNLCKYIASNVPSLKEFHDLQPSTQQKNGASILKTLSSIMISLQGYTILCFIYYYYYYFTI